MRKTPALLILTTSLAVWASAPLVLAETNPTPGEVEFFEKKIRPVLVNSCFKCHSTEGEKIKGNLTLDTREVMLKGGDSGPAIVPGDPNKSLLVTSMRHDDPDLSMPPKSDRLPDEVIANFEKWVKMGAPDPRKPKSAVAATARTMDMERLRAEHWSYKPIANPEPPQVKDPKHFVQNPVDNFVLAKLQEKGLTPSGKADKRALIRRASYDLTGLPPSPEEVEEFVTDNAPDAFAKVIDRLLASPRYGERWGRHWLDIARYADTSGDRLAGKREVPLYPYAWTYRDWVIEAVNNDMPYDRFIMEQIAGDKLPEAQTKDVKEAKEVLPALGFLTVGKRFMGKADDVIDDQIDVVTKGLMGMTASCARCHDHKFDPIPTKDYYSLHGVFASCQEPQDKPLIENPEEDPQYKDFLKEVQRVEDAVQDFTNSESARLLGGMLDKGGDYLMFLHQSSHTKDTTKKGGNFRVAARQAGLYAELAQIWLENFKSDKARKSPAFNPWFRFEALSDEEFAEKAPQVTADIVAAKDGEVLPVLTKAFTEKQPSSLKDVADVYTEVFGKLRVAMHVKPYNYQRGKNLTLDEKQPTLADADMEGLRQEVYGPSSFIKPQQRNIESALGVNYTTQATRIHSEVVKLSMFHPGAPARAMVLEDARKPKDSYVFIRGESSNRGPQVPRQFPEILAGPNRKPFTDGSGRLDLAKAIVDPKNPLTARVIVNRVWQWHFGQAIVRTVSDFGTRSEPPTHPELLDYLATSLIQNGWSLKQLHRTIMLSSAYQQDSKPTKKGMELDPTNQFLWRANIQRLEFEQIRDSLLTFGGHLDLTMGGPPVPLVNGSGAGSGGYKTEMPVTTEVQQARRTVYGVVDRAALPEVFNTFDFANPDMSTGERMLTTVPQQALFLMNSPFIVSQVKHLLARPDFPASGSDEEKVSFIYRTLYQRAPSAGEVKLAVDFLNTPAETPAADATVATVATAQTVSMPADERKNKKNAKEQAALAVSDTLLNTWERYTQVLMLANETVFLN